MSKFAEPMARLIDELKKLPGIGSKSAQRLAFHILRSTDADAEALAAAVRDVKATLSLGQLDVQGSSADAQVAGSYAYLNTSTHRTEQRPVSFHITFRRDTSGWRIAEVR